MENAEKLAKENIKSGNLYLLTFGDKMLHPVIDKETGLCIETIGCEVGKAETKYIQRYNELLTEHVLTDPSIPKDESYL